MIYEYRCKDCLHNFDVVKPVRDLELTHECPACGFEETVRLFSPKIYISGAKVEDAEYNPGLGCVIKNKNHRAEVAKQKDLIEVGNESTNTLHRETVEKKQIQKQKEWDAL